MLSVRTSPIQTEKIILLPADEQESYMKKFIKLLSSIFLGRHK